MQEWDLLLTGARIATMATGDETFGIVEKGALTISGDRIAWLGREADLPAGNARQTRDLSGRWLTPALIDCHTHLVFAGNRAAEFEQRRQGASYEEIARAGGGIMATVSATRAATADTLLAQSLTRLEALRNDGCATLEIKSGYGLDLETELKMLRTARELGRLSGLSIVTTFLGAHAVPAEFKGKEDAYIDLVCEQMLPAVVAESLADAVDAYCESFAFSPAQVTRVFQKARELGLPVKLHADQLSDTGSARLAAEFNALSADHLEYSSSIGLDAMATAGTVAVLLPGAFVMLHEKQPPPVAKLRKRGIAMAVASDCNPGTSPLCSLRTAMALAGSQFGLTPAECLAGTTRHAARALGLRDRGVLAAGLRADIAAWDIDHPRELSYWIGMNPLTDMYVGGRCL